MFKAAIALIVLAVPLGAFAWWGMGTRAGRAKFDEMDGMYPLLSGVGAAICAVGAVVLFGFSQWLGNETAMSPVPSPGTPGEG